MQLSGFNGNFFKPIHTLELNITKKVVIREFIKLMNCNNNDYNLGLHSYLTSGVKNENFHNMKNQIEMHSVLNLRENNKQPALLILKEVRSTIENLFSLFKKYSCSNSLSKTINYFNRTPIQILEFEIINLN